ncbi:MAG: hypothetical protein OEM97_02065 [Acidimicrobiia bacterium]|nr:hypothetical protein [Acidimicrobiia bacterium]
MPIHVDIDQRRRDIAEATFAVAAREGMAAVTLRSVAQQLNASTTTITNYLPTRTELLVNAVEQIGQEWLEELDDILADGEGPAGLRRLMRATVTWDHAEQLRCSFWVALLSARGRSPEVDQHLIDTSVAVHSVIQRVVAACGHPAPDVAADLLFLFAQGAFVSIVEAPREWPVSRLVAAADAVTDSALAAASA